MAVKGMIVRKGQISTIDPATCRARVAFDDLDETVSNELPICQRRTAGTKHYDLPEIGEHVLCIFDPSGEEQGWVLTSFYTLSNLPENIGEGRYITEYSDGTIIEYDTKKSKLTLIGAQSLEIEAQSIAIKGNIVVQGSVAASGDITAAAVSLSNHTHGGVESGGGSTGGPQ